MLKDMKTHTHLKPGQKGTRRIFRLIVNKNFENNIFPLKTDFIENFFENNYIY